MSRNILEERFMHSIVILFSFQNHTQIYAVVFPDIVWATELTFGATAEYYYISKFAAVLASEAVELVPRCLQPSSKKSFDFS